MLQRTIKRIPLLGPALARLKRATAKNQVEFDSGKYWHGRYVRGGNSGAGSYNRLAEFKAEFLNRFVVENGIKTVAELGSGDGAQLSLATYPKYTGYDVSEKAVEICKERFAGQTDRDFAFHHLTSETRLVDAELYLSLDVLYHLVEDDVFDRYMRDLFAHATRFVIIYSSNFAAWPTKHVRHRRYIDWTDANARDFVEVDHVPNRYPFDENDPDHTTHADFRVFARRTEPIATE